MKVKAGRYDEDVGPVAVSHHSVVCLLAVYLFLITTASTSVLQSALSRPERSCRSPDNTNTHSHVCTYALDTSICVHTHAHTPACTDVKMHRKHMQLDTCP